MKKKSLSFLLISFLAGFDYPIESKSIIDPSYQSSWSNYLLTVTGTVIGTINPYEKSTVTDQALKRWIKKEKVQENLIVESETKITKNPDQTTTIDYFNAEHKNIIRKTFNKKGSLDSIILFDDNGVQTKASFCNDKTMTVDQYNADRTQQSSTYINAVGKTVKILKFHPDKSQTQINYHPDRTKTIIEFNAQGYSSAKKEYNHRNALTKTIEFHDDGTQSITIHNKDKSQATERIDHKGSLIGRTNINTIGIKTHATAQQLTAWHEAGHAVSQIHNHSSTIIHHITIQPNFDNTSLGHVQSMSIHKEKLTRQELESNIITALCGGIAEQIVMSEKILTDQEKIAHYFAHGRFTEDIKQARNDAQTIILQEFQQATNKEIEQKIDGIIAQLYQQGYQFIASHKDEVATIAQALLEKFTLNTDLAYNLVNVKKPTIRM